MKSSAAKEDFSKIFITALVFLTSFYISFGVICYFTYGENLTEPIVLNMLPANNLLVGMTKLIYSVSLICSFPLAIYSVNSISERYIFNRNKRKRVFAYQAIFRALVIICILYLAIKLADKLDKFTSIMGALLCGPLAFTTPAALHLKVVARTQREKVIDMILIGVSLLILVMSTLEGIQNW